jgi:hypothetical protein
VNLQDVSQFWAVVGNFLLEACSAHGQRLEGQNLAGGKDFFGHDQAMPSTVGAYVDGDIPIAENGFVGLLHQNFVVDGRTLHGFKLLVTKATLILEAKCRKHSAA